MLTASTAISIGGKVYANASGNGTNASTNNHDIGRALHKAIGNNDKTAKIYFNGISPNDRS